MVQIQACTNYGSQRSGWATREETIFTRVYWKESFKMKYLTNFNQLGTNHSCIKGIHEGPGPLQRGIITKVQK
jgi:hypothetical protein